MSTKTEEAKIVEEGFKLGHIAVPEGSKWLTQALATYKESILSECEKSRYPQSFTFEYEYHSEGWTAQCLEVPAIITGGTEIKPSEECMMTMIEDAILTAMGKKITLQAINSLK